MKDDERRKESFGSLITLLTTGFLAGVIVEGLNDKTPPDAQITLEALGMIPIITVLELAFLRRGLLPSLKNSTYFCSIMAAGRYVQKYSPQIIDYLF